MRPKSFLIIQTAFIGDVILATALIEKFHAFFPDAHIDFLLRKGNEGLLVNHPYLREVIVFDKKNKYSNLWKLLKKIRSTQYHVLINAQRFATTGIITIFSKAGQTVGFDKNPFSFLFLKRIKHQVGALHEVERNQKLITHLTDPVAAKPRLYPSSADEAKVKPFVVGRYFCIAPTSVWFTKQWPAEKWIELIQLTSSKADAIYLLGAPTDHHVCESIRLTVSSNKVVNLAGKLSFLESAALMQKASMNFVNDSAPMHLASAMNAPVTAIYCSTIPEFGFGPLSDVSYVIQTSDEDLPCRPCGLHGYKDCPKGHFDCAYNIDVAH
ncbi:MAG: glycosyltransferase family 9 protein, partial [Cytophagales bacterium]